MLKDIRGFHVAKTKEKAEKWDRVFEDVEQTRRDGGKLPDTKPYEELTKSTGTRDR